MSRHKASATGSFEFAMLYIRIFARRQSEPCQRRPNGAQGLKNVLRSGTGVTIEKNLRSAGDREIFPAVSLFFSCLPGGKPANYSV